MSQGENRFTMFPRMLAGRLMSVDYCQSDATKDPEPTRDQYVQWLSVNAIWSEPANAQHPEVIYLSTTTLPPGMLAVILADVDNRIVLPYVGNEPSATVHLGADIDDVMMSIDGLRSALKPRRPFPFKLDGILMSPTVRIIHDWLRLDVSREIHAVHLTASTPPDGRIPRDQRISGVDYSSVNTELTMPWPQPANRAGMLLTAEMVESITKRVRQQLTEFDSLNGDPIRISAMHRRVFGSREETEAVFGKSEVPADIEILLHRLGIEAISGDAHMTIVKGRKSGLSSMLLSRENNTFLDDIFRMGPVGDVYQEPLSEDSSEVLRVFDETPIESGQSLFDALSHLFSEDDSHGTPAKRVGFMGSPMRALHVRLDSLEQPLRKEAKEQASSLFTREVVTGAFLNTGMRSRQQFANDRLAPSSGKKGRTKWFASKSGAVYPKPRGW